MSAEERPMAEFMREAVVAALEAHEVVWIDHEVGYDCGCNEYGTLPGMPTQADALRHQADEVMKALAPHIEAER